MFRIQRKKLHFLKPIKKRQGCCLKNPNQIRNPFRLPWKRWREEPHYFYGLDLIPHKTFLCDFSVHYECLKHPEKEMKPFRLIFELNPKAYMFIGFINPMQLKDQRLWQRRWHHCCHLHHGGRHLTIPLHSGTHQPLQGTANTRPLVIVYGGSHQRQKI